MTSRKAQQRKKIKRAILLGTSIRRSTASGSALCCIAIRID